MKALWQMLVKPIRMEGGYDPERKLWIPNTVERFDPEYRFSEHESRPVSAVVLATPIHGFLGISQNGNLFPVDAMARGVFHPGRNKHVYTPVKRERMPWRMPDAGDTVWFGFSDWEWPDAGDAFMFPDQIHCVVPESGEPWAMGEWALLDQVPEKAIRESGIVAHTGGKTKLATGIVRMIGDGFSRARPSVKIGDLVVFKSWGDSNTVCPNPFGGTDMTRIDPSMLVAIDATGMTEDEYQALLKESKGIEAEAGSIKRAIKADNFLNDHKARGREQREANEKRAKKDWDRRYHGHRNTY